CEKKIITSPQKMVEIISQENLFSEYLQNKSKISILLGALALNHPEASKIRFYTQKLAEQHQATIGYLYEGANNAGAWIAGCIPHRSAAGETVMPAGYSVSQSLQANLKAYI